MGINKQVLVYLRFLFADTFYAVINNHLKAVLHCENPQRFMTFLVSE